MNNENEHKKRAALWLALAVCRGVIGEVLDGNLRKDDLKRVYDASAKIAQAIGMAENDLALDWRDYLSEDEIETIKGFS